MIKLLKNEFFIYCKDSRIEHNRAFYGSFILGPFEPEQSITLANALRRTLLSEIKGLAITSVEIEGVFHEYSTLPGVRDSILDILLNLKDIVLKLSNYGNQKICGGGITATFKNQQIGYLKSKGPGIIKAFDLKLPPGIQCVDPEQYIATLSEEGILNMKFLINSAESQSPGTKLDYNNDFLFSVTNGSPPPRSLDWSNFSLIGALDSQNQQGNSSLFKFSKKKQSSLVMNLSDFLIWRNHNSFFLNTNIQRFWFKKIQKIQAKLMDHALAVNFFYCNPRTAPLKHEVGLNNFAKKNSISPPRMTPKKIQNNIK